MAAITPTRIRYIKLGAGGQWEAAALEGGTLEWGSIADPHEAALAGDWAAVRDTYVAAGRLVATATGYTNEARAFYDRDGTVLWVTFARGRMWWTFADPEVRWLGDSVSARGSRSRGAIGGWSDTDINGSRLDLDRLSTKLTKLAGYRRTICSLSEEQAQLCLRYINAAADKERSAVMTAQAELERTLLTLIRRLSWSDFEQLVDHILDRSGWVRTSVLGGHQKDVDLIVEQPLTGERLIVQVKSQVTQAVVNACAANLAVHDKCGSMLIAHTAVGNLRSPDDGNTMTLMLGEALARHATRAGLTEWVLQRA